MTVREHSTPGGYSNHVATNRAQKSAIFGPADTAMYATEIFTVFSRWLPVFFSSARMRSQEAESTGRHPAISFFQCPNFFWQESLSSVWKKPPCLHHKQDTIFRNDTGDLSGLGFLMVSFSFWFIKRISLTGLASQPLNFEHQHFH
jgi:hypothetical protein